MRSLTFRQNSKCLDSATNKSTTQISPYFQQVAIWLGVSRQPKYTIFLSQPTSNLVQVADVSKDHTDHKTFAIETPLGKVVISNEMMQCSTTLTPTGEISRTNNGFHQSETRKQYQQRIQNNLTNWKNRYHADPKIVAFLMQEAPIHPEDIQLMADFFEKHFSDWRDAHFDMTDFGLMGFFKKTVRGESIQTNTQFVDTLEERLKTRIQTFAAIRSDNTLDSAYQISNVHVPHPPRINNNQCMHDKPKLTEMELEKLLKPLINALILNDSSEIRRHDVVGDFNLNPDSVKSVALRLLETAINARKTQYPQAQPLHIEFFFDPSPNGHRHIHDNQVEFLTVDGILSLRRQPAENYRIDARSISLGYIIGLFMCAGSFLTSLAPEEEAAAAVSANLLLHSGLFQHSTAGHHCDSLLHDIRVAIL